MISGLNQEVEILGRIFHVQTETSGTAIRTEVFVGGKVVAARESQLDAQQRQGGDETLLALMKEQHQKILTGMVRRAERYRERQSREVPVMSAAEAAAAVAAAREAEREARSAAAPSTQGSGVEVGLRVRRFLERFRLRFAALSGACGDNPGACLEGAAEAFAWIVASPAFRETRIADQVRFNLLKDRIEGWLQSARDADGARNLWSEVVDFNDSIARVNNRSELAAFDRDLLTWTLRKVASDGMSARLLEHLRMVSGRDGRLDRLLEAPEGVTTEVWDRELHRVLEAIR